MEKIKIEIDEILDPYDLYESARMLSELQFSKPEEALQLAYKILDKNIGDDYYQAGAFDTIYGIDQARGFEYIQQHINDASLPVYGSMVESVTVDSGIYDESEGIEEVVLLLKNRMVTLTAEESEKIKGTLSWFKETYSQLF